MKRAELPPEKLEELRAKDREKYHKLKNDPETFARMRKRQGEAVKRWNARNPDKRREMKREQMRRAAAANPKKYQSRVEHFQCTPYGRACSLLAQAKRSAAVKGMEFSLEKDDIVVAIAEGVCSVTGIPFDLARHNPWSPSLDRIDSSLGYTKENTRVVCWMFNAAKNKWRDEDVLRMCEAIHERASSVDCN
jgi:hypothetical protein